MLDVVRGKTKTEKLLDFLYAIHNLRRGTHRTYSSNSKIFWFYEIECLLNDPFKNHISSSIFTENQDNMQEELFFIRKKEMLHIPPIPEELKPYLPEDFDSNIDDYITKGKEDLIRLFNDETSRTYNTPLFQNFLQNDPHKLDSLRVLWESYIEEKLIPWLNEYNLNRIFQRIDEFRRRIREAEERFEVVFAIGLIQWRDQNMQPIKRHILTTPAEIELDAENGILRVSLSENFDKFRLELDMLDPEIRPFLDEGEKERLLRELSENITDGNRIERVFNFVANNISPNAEIYPRELKPADRTDGRLRITYAPALVLRERQSTGYAEFVTSIKGYTKGVSERDLKLTEPWLLLLAEGEEVDESLKLTSTDKLTKILDDRLYFPLPMNEEQKRIVEKLKRQFLVLVKGPPGTGKSHTIANLICHLLANGERVLITAHTAKALTVLHNLMPKEIRDLCIISLESSRKDQDLLGRSIRQIIQKKDSWNANQVENQIRTLEEGLRNLEARGAKLNNMLRQCREAEIYVHELNTNYRGKLAQIAQKVDKDRSQYVWIPPIKNLNKSYPLDMEEDRFFKRFYAGLSLEKKKELEKELGNPKEFPDPNEVIKIMETIRVKEVFLNSLSNSEKLELLSILKDFSDFELESLLNFLNILEENIKKSCVTLTEFFQDVIDDLLTGQFYRWERLLQDIKLKIESIQGLLARIGQRKIRGLEDIPRRKIFEDVKLRIRHFEEGGGKGLQVFGINLFVPRVIKKTQYVEERCWIDGKNPEGIEDLQILADYLELIEELEELREYPKFNGLIHNADPVTTAKKVLETVEELNNLILIFKEKGEDVLKILPIEKRSLLKDKDYIRKWEHAIGVEFTIREYKNLLHDLGRIAGKIRAIPEENRHPCINTLIEAIKEINPEKWKSAWEQRERALELKKEYVRFQKLCEKLDEGCPGIKRLLEDKIGDHQFIERVQRIDHAWDWAQAKAWLEMVIRENSYQDITREMKALEEKIKNVLLKLIELKSWKAFFERLDYTTHQHLISWQNAMRRFGKGTGRFALKHRQEARKHLQKCIPKIPVWIMPLYRLWETAPSTIGVFDTIIIDEASQAWIDSLLLFLLGKRVIVVGDDMQNSPEAVGIREEEMRRLISEYLREFEFSNEFRLDSSLFDHANRIVGQSVTLREHFRCVPEIIRFSNDLCYDNQLIPLREPPPNRLQPLIAKYVGDAYCEGEGARIRNIREAEEIVKAIKECIADERYRDKTMGVIVLQGHYQAELIEKIVTGEIDQRELEERRFICGTPAEFQGDERDVIFLSLVVAPNYGYRALTTLGDIRRFNVAMSRAKDQVWLFHSVKLEDLRPDDLRYKILKFFYDKTSIEGDRYIQLERLLQEIKNRPRTIGSQPEPFESWFEVDVAWELLRRGYKVIPQYQASGYRIDLVIEGNGKRLAIECDSEAWHGPEMFEYDMARQRQLERAGWRFIHIRESEFYINRQKSISLIEEVCRDLGITPEI